MRLSVSHERGVKNYIKVINWHYKIVEKWHSCRAQVLDLYDPTKRLCWKMTLEVSNSGGHCRNAAQAYSGAPIVECEHPELKSGDRCPECEKGKVYESPPKSLVKVVGQAPLGATVYRVRRLRCRPTMAQGRYGRIIIDGYIAGGVTGPCLRLGWRQTNAQHSIFSSEGYKPP